MMMIPVFDANADASVSTQRLLRWQRITARTFFTCYGVTLAVTLLAVVTLGLTLNTKLGLLFLPPLYTSMLLSTVFFVISNILDGRAWRSRGADFDAFFAEQGVTWFSTHRDELPVFTEAQQRTLLRGSAVILTDVRYLATRDVQAGGHVLRVADRVRV